MNACDSYRAHHATLRAMCADIERTLQQGVTAPGMISWYVSRLSAALERYPSVDDAQINPNPRLCEDGAAALSAAVAAFGAWWNDPVAILADTAGFGTAWTTICDAILLRIAREERVLEPLAAAAA